MAVPRALWPEEMQHHSTGRSRIGPGWVPSSMGGAAPCLLQGPCGRRCDFLAECNALSKCFCCFALAPVLTHHCSSVTLAPSPASAKGRRISVHPITFHCIPSHSIASHPTPSHPTLSLPLPSIPFPFLPFPSFCCLSLSCIPPGEGQGAAHSPFPNLRAGLQVFHLLMKEE